MIVAKKTTLQKQNVVPKKNSIYTPVRRPRFEYCAMSTLSERRPQSTVQTATKTPSTSEDRQTGVPIGFHRPRRQNTWPRARQVVVLIRSDDSVYLENREEVDGKFTTFRGG